jgi:anaerobic magnesium-protoporphyrin IX monomethyl ester cyclase
MTRPPDCVLVRLPEDTVGFYRFSESLGLGYVAAALRAGGHRVEIIDGTIDGLDAAAITHRILAAPPALVGFSVMFAGHAAVRAIADALRRGGYRGHITLGQHFATFNAERILADTPAVSSVVRFEGEQTAGELLAAVQAGRPLDGILGLAFRDGDGHVVVSPPRPLIEDLDRLPFPARDVLARNQDTVTTVNISASRGCPWRCNFCTIPAFYRTPAGKVWRHRGPANIVAEMDAIVDRFGPRPFFFVDDQFMGGGRAGRDFARDLARTLIERGPRAPFAIETRADTVEAETLGLLQQAGLRLVFVGVESGYQPTLDYYRKDISVAENLRAVTTLKDLGLDVQMGFIMFHEGTTLDEVRTNLAFLEQTDAFDAVPFFNELKVHAGSAFMPADATGLAEDYQRPWQIADRRARAYRDELQRAVLPLTVPAHTLRIDRRFLGALPADDMAGLEARLRRAFLAIARALLDAVDEDRLTDALIADLRRLGEVEAARLRADIDAVSLIRALRGRASGGQPPAGALASTASRVTDSRT